MPPDRPKSPEEQELDAKRQELCALETELAEREAELVEVQADLIEFEQRSQSELDPRYEELANLNQRIGELLTQIKPTTDNGDTAANSSSSKPPPSRAPQSRASIPPPPKRPRPDVADEAELDASADNLKRLYRDVAKLVHPDLAEDDVERQHRHALMIRANAAYDAGDESKLSDIIHEWESCPEAIRGENTAAQLIRTIRRIYRAKLRLAMIATELDRLAGTSLYNLLSMADAAEDYQRDLLAEMAQRLDGDIATAKARLAELEKLTPPVDEDAGSPCVCHPEGL